VNVWTNVNDGPQVFQEPARTKPFPPRRRLPLTRRRRNRQSVCQDPRRIPDGDAALGGCWNIYIIDAYRMVADYFELWSGSIHHRAVNVVSEQ
jgi:hypothetical protein